MEHFTPVSALAGGVLIGLSTATLWLLDGRIGGISGILGGLFRPAVGDIGWRAAFLAGLLAAAPVAALATGRLPDIAITPSLPALVAAGLLVGIGTRLGSGCTSGHGVCGLARLSRRSMAAAAVFVGTAIVTVFIVRHLLAAGL